MTHDVNMCDSKTEGGRTELVTEAQEGLLSVMRFFHLKSRCSLNWLIEWNYYLGSGFLQRKLWLPVWCEVLKEIRL